MTLTLHQYGAALGLADISPFCGKLDAFLRITSIPFVSKASNPLKAPKGKLPYIEHEGKQISDSSHIIQYLSKAHGIDLDGALTPAQRATRRAFQSLIEEHLYFVLLYFRWSDEDGWRQYKPVISDVLGRGGVPKLVRPLVLASARRGVKKSLHEQGTGRHSKDELLASGKELIDAIATQLDDHNYFLGDRPTMIDATAYAFLAGVIIAPITSELQDHARSHTNLVAYCERFRERYYETSAAA